MANEEILVKFPLDVPAFHYTSLCLCLSALYTVARLQDARMAVLKDLLRLRNEVQKEVTSKRLNQIYSKYQRDKETKLHKIHNDYIRCKTTAAD